MVERNANALSPCGCCGLFSSQVLLGLFGGYSFGMCRAVLISLANTELLFADKLSVPGSYERVISHRAEVLSGHFPRVVSVRVVLLWGSGMQ